MCLLVNLDSHFYVKNYENDETWNFISCNMSEIQIGNLNFKLFAGN